jgi:hypothetical protein
MGAGNRNQYGTRVTGRTAWRQAANGLLFGDWSAMIGEDFIEFSVSALATNDQESHHRDKIHRKGFNFPGKRHVSSALKNHDPAVNTRREPRL